MTHVMVVRARGAHGRPQEGRPPLTPSHHLLRFAIRALTLALLLAACTAAPATSDVPATPDVPRRSTRP